MFNDNGFYLIIAIVFARSTQLVLLGPKDQDLVIPFRLDEGETIPYFNLRALKIRSELGSMKDKTRQTNNSQVNKSWNCQN